MTVGEKIQHYRKRAGLSQEELGQQLLVSRQTVSLWETGQTLPTLDNLSRLRTIFGVSVDEILSEELANGDAGTVSEKEKASQVETTFLPYHRQELRSILWHTLCVPVLLTLLSLFVLSFAILSLIFVPVWSLICVVAGALVGFLWQVLRLLVQIARVRCRVRFLQGCTYSCTSAATQLCFALKEGEMVCECYAAAADEVQQLWRSKRLVCIAVRGQRIYMDRALLEGEQFGAFLQAKKEPTHPKRRLSTGALLAAGVGALVALGLTVVFYLYGAPWRANVSALLLFAAAGMAIACAVIGICLKRAQTGWKKNTLVGFLLAALMLVGGVGTVISALPRPVYDTQQCLGMTLPACDNVVIAEGGYTSEDLFVYYRADFYFGDEEAVAWEQELAHSTSLFDKMGGVTDSLPFPPDYLPSPDFGRGARAFLLFDAQAQQKVKGLEGTGYHEYLLLAYFPNENMLSVAKFNLYIAE